METAMAQDSETTEQKVARVFGRLAIDKRRLGLSQLQKRGIPAYVAEWVLDSVVPGTGALTHEEADKVQEWASRRIPGSADQELIKYRLIQGETVKILTPVQTEVRLRRDNSEVVAELSLLGLDDILIGNELLQEYPDLLKQGMWGVTEVVNTSSGVAISSFKPMQATVNLSMYKEARKEFSLTEWQELMLLSMGYSPASFSQDEQLILLSRLLPLVQKNLHLMELAPKGTGKSYLYENISPKVRLVSGGNISPAVLFVNNASGQWGLLARFAVLVLDEVQTLKFSQPDEIVGGLKGYLANGVLSRGASIRRLATAASSFSPISGWTNDSALSTIFWSMNSLNFSEKRRSSIELWGSSLVGKPKNSIAVPSQIPLGSRRTSSEMHYCHCETI